MRTTALSPALQLTSEEDALVSKSTALKLTYSQAVYSYFVAGQGQIYQVAMCSIEQFVAFAERCILTAKNPKACEKRLAGLDYAELLDRWYCLDTLRVFNATVPLYSSIEEAEQGVQ